MIQLAGPDRSTHVGSLQLRRELMTPWPIAEEAQAHGLTVADASNLHVTVIWSRDKVDWSRPVFTPRNDFVVIPPQKAKVERFEDGSIVVLKIECPEIEARHAELRGAGASWDYPVYNPHITLGPIKGSVLPNHVNLKDGLLLGPERRMST